MTLLSTTGGPENCESHATAHRGFMRRGESNATSTLPGEPSKQARISPVIGLSQDLVARLDRQVVWLTWKAKQE